MQIKKSDPGSLINLQNGEYLHLTPEFIIINDTLNFEKENLKYDLSKTKNRTKFRLFINVIFTVSLFAFAIYTQFYPLVLLMFVSIWDIRQLKRYHLPINKSKVIPIQNIYDIKIKKGQLGFNYIDVFIEFNGVKSFIPLQLYDSESTLEQAKRIAIKLGKLTDSPTATNSKISGQAIAVNEISQYILSDGKWYYIENGVFNNSRIDNYKYLRALSYFFIALGTFMIGIKIYLMATNGSNYIDFIVLILLLLLLLIPIKYSKKSLPNTFTNDEIVKVVKKKKKTMIELKEAFRFNRSIHIKNKFINSDFYDLLKMKDHDNL